MKSFRTQLIGVLIGALITVVVMGLQYAGVFNAPELRSYDLRFKLRGAKPPPKDILLVTIDEETRRVLNKGLNQITRDDYARLIDILKQNEAKLIVFDIDFASGKDGDTTLAESISCAGNVIMSSFIAMGDWVRPTPQLLDPNTPCPVDDAVTDVPSQVMVGEDGKATIEWKAALNKAADSYRVYYSVAAFDDPKKISPDSGGYVDVAGTDRSLTLTLQGATPGGALYVAVKGVKINGLAGEGAVNIVEDQDDRVRRIPLVVGRSADDPDRKAALSLETAIRAIFGEEPKLVESAPSMLRFEGGGKSLIIPLVDGRMFINYRGGRDTFERVSFGEVLEGKAAPEVLKGKIILVGNTHHLAHDEYPTPFGRQTINAKDTGEAGIRAGFTSGLEIHANSLATILKGDYIYPLGVVIASRLSKSEGASRMIANAAPIVITLILGLVATLLLITLRVKIGVTTGIFAGLILIVAIAVTALFLAYHIWAPAVAPMVALVGIYGGGLFYHVWVEGREKRWIKDTFGKYLAPSVVDQITRDPSRLRLGGEELELTAFFSDIQGFTSISEQLASPQKLVELLNEYLTGMANTIERYEGTVDKYEGDAVIAFWGAPIHFEDHALKACFAALDQQKKFEELREMWKAGGKWPSSVLGARVRMGINTGRMVVGNMGSKGRMNYTMMGDPVNLASRLEGVNKQYGTLIMISEDTYAMVKDSVEARELDTIRVVGKAKPVTIYELLARKGELGGNMARAKEAFEQGLRNYRLRRFELAMASFEAALQAVPDDAPSKKYIERCRAFIKQPPPENWDGVFEMKTK